MKGPYTANKDKTITYNGNKVFSKIDDVTKELPNVTELENRVKDLNTQEMWQHIAEINHRINISSNKYFDKLGSLFVPLPLVTRMISSPGAVHGKEAINYTTDTCPITLNWFDLPKTAFLSESSQIYLELALMQQEVNQVYSIYNSFRKEEADYTHLSEFHHIEYEGNVTQQENENIALGLIKNILLDLIEKNYEDLAFFLEENKISELKNLADNIKDIPKISFKEALNYLYKETRDEKYKEYTLKHFGSWEEVKLTEILGTMVLIKEFPLLEVPFYHARKDNAKPERAINSDLIWPGYREILGSGLRVRSTQELEEKSEIFSLPKKDYQPYLQTRELENYKTSAGFGLGWERLLQGLLELPTIWTGVQFPRTDETLKP